MIDLEERDLIQAELIIPIEVPEGTLFTYRDFDVYMIGCSGVGEYWARGISGPAEGLIVTGRPTEKSIKRMINKWWKEQNEHI